MSAGRGEPEARPVIAIDGPAAAGKGTLARGLAAHYGFAHLDSGALYRLAALYALKAGLAPDDPALPGRLEKLMAGRLEGLEDPDLRSPAMAEAASRYAARPGLRAALKARQRQFAADPPGGAGGAVLEGRDIGTVIAPDADAKIFVTASLAARARRRALEERRRLPAGAAVNEARLEAEVKARLRARDQADCRRAAAPLLRASDAHLLNTTDLSIEAALARAVRIIDAALAAARRRGGGSSSRRS